MNKLESIIKTKEDWKDLVIFGGQSNFTSPLHVGTPNVGDRSRLFERFNDILDRRWFSNNGPYVQEFEAYVRDALGVRHCVATANGTLALEIMMRAAVLQGEVLLPSFTFVATAHAMEWQGFTPVFCDIRKGSHSLDPHRVAEMITPRTTAIVGVHVWGEPCFIDELTQLAENRNIPLLFDASHAFGCSYKGKMVGNFGRAEVFSFHATKFINTFEGGAITCNDDELAERMRLMRNFGFAGYDNVVSLGINGKMNEISAAMGLTMLESKDEIIVINKNNYQQYKANLKGIVGINLLEINDKELRNYQYVVLEVDERLARIQRDTIMLILHAEGVLARRYFYPGCHRMAPYHSKKPLHSLSLPNTENLCDRVLLLPSGQRVTLEDIDEICALIRLIVQNADVINDKLNG
jgi:dTDP-4-amino-4,6-dideoxygalactose transaminase